MRTIQSSPAYLNLIGIHCDTCNWWRSPDDMGVASFNDSTNGELNAEVRCPTCHELVISGFDSLFDIDSDPAPEGSFISLLGKAQTLVKQKITGHRKGLPNIPTYTHSFRVLELVKKHKIDDETAEDIQLAALLHDAVEDGGVTFEELIDMGFSERTVELVRLCSHGETDMGKEARWLLMMAALVRAREEDAWRIKLADLTDNLTESKGLLPNKRRFMIETKASLMWHIAKNMPLLQTFCDGLAEEAERQRVDMNGPAVS